MVEGRLSRIENEIVRTERRREFERIFVFLFDEANLLGWRVRIGIDLARLEAQKSRGAIFQRQDDLAIDRDMLGIVKILVLDEDSAIVREIIFQPIGAVADEIAGAREIVAVAADIALFDRRGGLM